MEPLQLLKCLHQLRDDGTRMRLETRPKTWTDNFYTISKIEMVTVGSDTSWIMTFKGEDTTRSMLLGLDRVTGLALEKTISFDGQEGNRLVIKPAGFEFTLLTM